MYKKILLFVLAAMSLFAAQPRAEVCAQVITYAKSPTGECAQYPTPCDVPSGYTTVASCDANGSMRFLKGWNMISSPVNASFEVSQLPSSKISAKWGYHAVNGYYEAVTIDPYKGFWIKATEAFDFTPQQTAPFTYALGVTQLVTNAVASVWNLLGLPQDTTVTQIKAAGASVVYSYDAASGAYSTADTIKAGSGFWIKKPAATAVFAVASGDIADAQAMDLKFANSIAGGQNLSPAISWSGVLQEAKSLAVEMVDLDYQNSVHWAVLNIPTTITQLPQGVANGYSGIVFAANDYSQDGSYAGPFPPKGETHRYKITVYALSVASVTTMAQAKQSIVAQASVTPVFTGR